MKPEQIELQMRVFNERIEETERTLEWLLEQRREFINRHNLNKALIAGQVAIDVVQHVLTSVAKVTEPKYSVGEFLLPKHKGDSE